MQKLTDCACSKRKSMVSARSVNISLASIICVTLVLCSSVLSFSRLPASAQKPQDFGLPQLHKINSATLQPSYSCRPQEEFQRGYQRTALFLSKYSRDMNSPELLFDGACRGPDVFQSPGDGGDTMNLIEDMGEIALESVTAQAVFQTRDAHFESHAKVHLNHTYAVLVNEFGMRGLFVFTVVEHTPNQRVDLKYAAKEYQIVSGHIESSPGFAWGKGNL